jgi:phosphomethylpyrimidine synthase
LAALASIASPVGPALRVGDGELVRVMALIGSTSREDERAGHSKVESLAGYASRPDVVADLSLRLTDPPLWRRILAAALPAATLPVYTARRRNGRIDRGALLDRAIEQLEGGVGMITIHPTARRDIIALARRRNVPWSSRGGGLIVTDLLAGSQAQNAYLDILQDLAPMARAHGATISIGATFRSATVMDADDEAQREEIAFQGELAAQLSAMVVRS